VHYAIDAIGLGKTQQQILEAVRQGYPGGESGGTALLLGVTPPGVEVTLDTSLFSGGRRFTRALGGDCRPDRDFPTFVRWYRQGKLKLDELVSRRIQLTQLVPTLIRAVTEEVAGRSEPPDLSHLTEIVYGASPIQPDLLARAVCTLGCRFRQNYASTETGPLPISSLAPADHDPARGRLATAGRPSLGWEVRIGDLGEVQVRGSVPLPGYWHNPEATSQVTTADGFHRTGDVGVLDPDGYLTIVDRLTDMIVSGGENVYPSEVEAALAGHPAVADVAVIGIPDPRWGETVHAVVVGRPGLDTGELIVWARGRLAGFKCPTSVTTAAELPRNATGKVLRAALREPFWAGRDRNVS